MARARSIGEILPQYLREEGLETPLLCKQVVERWSELMGPMVAGMTRSVEVENGVLRLRMNNAALRAQLFEQRFELVQRINEKMGAQVITDVRLLG